LLGNHWKYQGPRQQSDCSESATSTAAKLDHFEAEWFKGKKVLDIGSHDGTLDLLLAARFTPRLLIGVEIDHRLATKAVKNMQDFINKEECMDLI
jgi:7SK snRNA methylphosphate capping enzyme